MADDIETRLIGIVQSTLREQSGDGALAVSADDSMETVAAWDSLSFMSVFEAVNAAFEIEPDFDDAVHYTSIAALRDYLEGVRA